MSKQKGFLGVLAALCVSGLASRAEATHNRFNSIIYTVPDPVSSPLTVRFDVVTAWRSDYLDATSLAFGDGQTNPSTQGTVIAKGVSSAGLSYTFLRYTVTHTYPAPGQYVASYNSCCRISELVNAPDNNFRAQALVDLTPGNKGNAVAVVPAIVPLQVNGIRTLTMAAADPDGVPVTCRFATPAESGMVAAAQPPLAFGTSKAATLVPSVSPPGCTLTWDLIGSAAGKSYGIQVVFESKNKLNNNVSTSVLDFIIETVLAAPPSCTGSGGFVVDMGQTLMASVIGTNNSGGSTLKMGLLGSIGVLNPVPGTTSQSPFTTNFSWTPGLGEAGGTVLAVTYQDEKNLTGFCTLAVNVPECPDFALPCSVGVGACLANGKKQCVGNQVVCSAVAGQPTAEKCNGIDDDCNGAIDENSPQSGNVCTTNFPSLCSSGISNCNMNTLECIPDVVPGSITEVCNTIDDDCDGLVDNGFNVGGNCTVGVGGCQKSGKFICDGMGGATCDVDPNAPLMEICDGQDNDCDNEADDGLGLGDACTEGVGECEQSGTKVCDVATKNVKCNATAGLPVFEVCGDAKDNDCDGTVDNGCTDTDGDGLADGAEVAFGSNPNDGDSDDDGVLDGAEPDRSADTDGDGLINLLDPDSDNDGLFDGTELGKNCNDPSTQADLGHCRADGDSGQTKSDPLSADTDGDTKSDGSEDANLNGVVDVNEGNPKNSGDASKTKDFDGDGLGDALEDFLKSDTKDADTDNDGLLDGDEANPSDDSDYDGLLNVLDVDSDNDALFDGTEMGKGCQHPSTDATLKHCRADADAGSTRTSPLLRDTDRGGVMDGAEDANLNGAKNPGELDPMAKADDGSVKDTDGDGLSDGLETTLGTGKNDADSDDDGLLDGDEPNMSDDGDGDGAANIDDFDSDNDGLFDGTEAGMGCGVTGTNPAAMKCIEDGDNGKTKTGVLLPDTDFGTKIDGEEDGNRNGVVDSGETDPLVMADDIPPPPECTQDRDCGEASSGRLCNANKCVDGCRGVGGNGCPTGKVCTSTTDLAGVCEAASTTGTPSTPDTGCGCRVASRSGDELAAFGALAALALVMRRRRR